MIYMLSLDHLHSGYRTDLTPSVTLHPV